MSAPATLYLQKNEQRRLRAGHLWVFSNEVDAQRSPLSGFEPGQQVTVADFRGNAVGSAYVNPHALICARLYSHQAGLRLDGALLVQRLRRAVELREALFDRPYYRAVFSEGDGLPGLTVDRYGGVVVIQITTAGMESLRAQILAAVQEVLAPAAVVWRNDAEARSLEGLAGYVETAAGRLPETVTMEENGCRFEIDPLAGQKTGWFFDHRMNRARMQRYVHGAAVLDVFSYIGGWGVQAAAAGAAQVLCLDSSAAALERLAHNAALNGVQAQVSTRNGDAFELLKQLYAEGRRFDVVTADPPAFIKRRKDAIQGTAAYQRLNHLALQLLNPGGVLISSSCSYHMSAAALQQAIVHAARSPRRSLQLLETGRQGPDHPVHPAMPENDYLKTLFMRALSGPGADW